MTLRMNWAGLALLLAGCGAETVETGRVEQTLASDAKGDTLAVDGADSAKSSSLVCGIGCPAGFYPSEYLTNIQCLGFPNRNQTRCHPVGGSSFTTCGLGCPAGYHPVRYDSSLECHFSFPNSNNTRCEANAGASFWSCGFSCPAGYAVAEFGAALECRGSFPSDNRVRCASLVNGTLSVSPSTAVVAAGQSVNVAVNWSTSGANSASVTVQLNGASEVQLAATLSGNTTTAVPGGRTATVRLYGNGQLLSTRTVEVRAQSGQIAANPSNLSLALGQVGTTRITWSSNLSNAQVSVAVNGAAATLFASGAQGAADAPWIVGGNRYSFRLHPMGEPSNILASVEVTTQGPHATIAAAPAQLSLPLNQAGTTRITWSTNLPAAEVWVAMNGQPATLFAGGPSGAADANWIVGGNQYLFIVRAPGQTTTLASVLVVATVHQGQGQISASPAQVFVVPGTVGTTRISWSTTLANAQVSVSMNGAAPTLFASGPSGVQDANWIQADHNYLFTVHPVGQPQTSLGQVLVTGVASVHQGQGQISASPTQVFVVPGTVGTTRISWSTTLANAQVSVSMNGAAPTLFAGGPSGVQDANWIQAGHNYLFTVHPVGQPQTSLGQVLVTGVAQ